MALEPITRQEKIIAGQDLTPITRMEKFLKDFGGGGGSIPKPLTYDYMPEGYPSKSIEPTTIMEEQEVAFADIGGIYAAAAPVEIDVLDGQTYTIVWDGVEYSCIGHVAGGNIYIGNPQFLGPESTPTGEPFLYAVVNQSTWISYDTTTSHTIGVTGPDTVYKTIDKKFLPEAKKFVVNATNLPTNTTGWRNLHDSLKAALDAGAEIFLDVYGNGKTLLKLTNAYGTGYLFMYPKKSDTVSAYILTAYLSDGGSLKEYDIYTNTGTT